MVSVFDIKSIEKTREMCRGGSTYPKPSVVPFSTKFEIVGLSTSIYGIQLIYRVVLL